MLVKAERLRETLERRNSLLNLQTNIRRVLHGENHPKHHKRTRNKSVHLQHAHKPVNWRTGKTNGKEKNQKNNRNKDDKTSRTLITPQSKIKNLVDRFNPSIIHSHNAPDFLTISAIESVNGEVPVIHDSHEALSLRKTGYYVGDDEKKVLNEYPLQEKIANEKSDGRIYVTEGVREYIQQRYDIDPSKDMVFYSYICKSMVPRRLREKLSEKDRQTHVVYAGTVTRLVEDSHYDLRQIFREITERKIHIHMQ